MTISTTRSEAELAGALARLAEHLRAIDLTLSDRPVDDPDALADGLGDTLAAVLGPVEEAASVVRGGDSDDGPLQRLVLVDGLLRAAARQFAAQVAGHAALAGLERMALRRRGEWPAWTAAFASAAGQAQHAFAAAGDALHTALADRVARGVPLRL